MNITISSIQQWLSGKKTYFVAATAFIGLLSTWSNHKIDNQTFIQDTVALVLAASMRGGVQKSGPITPVTPDPSAIPPEIQDIIDIGEETLLPPELLGRRPKKKSLR